MQSQIIFTKHKDFDFNDLEIKREEKQSYKKVDINFINPYKMNYNHVHTYHFRDARLYDPDINEPNWEIQNQVARKKYRQWLKYIRSQPGKENFRRPWIEIYCEVEDEDNNIIFVRKLVPYQRNSLDQQRQSIFVSPVKNVEIKMRQNAGTNHKQRLMPQSRDKGVKIDDVNFRPKMFTERMGKQISQLRNNLKLTQAELGKKINVDANTIKNIELGNLITFNSEDMMVKSLAKVLGLVNIKYQE